jgi:hypothetical protein
MSIGYERLFDLSRRRADVTFQVDFVTSISNTSSIWTMPAEEAGLHKAS